MTAREREMRRCATELLADLGVAAALIDPAWIARRQGFTVAEEPLSGRVCGALWRKGNRFGIIVSDACPTDGHRRFLAGARAGSPSRGRPRRGDVQRDNRGRPVPGRLPSEPQEPPGARGRLVRSETPSADGAAGVPDRSAAPVYPDPPVSRGGVLDLADHDGHLLRRGRRRRFSPGTGGC